MRKEEQIFQIVRDAGATNATVIDGASVVYDRSFREMCKRNQCGRYGKYYVCPPDVGDIDTLMAKAQAYPKAVLYQLISPLEDSFDIEGMQEAGKRNHDCAQVIQAELGKAGVTGCLQLSSGGCSLCARCGKLDNIPCRFPDRALSSMESYGVFVAETARNAGMKYVNGTNTITFFGIVFFQGD